MGHRCYWLNLGIFLFTRCCCVAVFPKVCDLGVKGGPWKKAEDLILLLPVAFSWLLVISLTMQIYATTKPFHLTQYLRSHEMRQSQTNFFKTEKTRFSVKLMFSSVYNWFQLLTDFPAFALNMSKRIWWVIQNLCDQHSTFNHVICLSGWASLSVWYVWEQSVSVHHKNPQQKFTTKIHNPLFFEREKNECRESLYWTSDTLMASIFVFCKIKKNACRPFFSQLTSFLMNKNGLLKSVQRALCPTWFCFGPKLLLDIHLGK